MVKFYYFLQIIVYMYHIFFVYSSVYVHLNYFLDLAIVNSASVNVGVPTYLFKLVWKTMVLDGMVKEVPLEE